MNESDAAWSRFRAEMDDLARGLRTKADLDEVKRAADAVIDSVNRVVADPEVREGTRRAARSFGDALAATLNQVADSLRSSQPK
ncbi:MAG TPA: hypothetical protein VF134_09100 [Candidatus Dormibacteraeota bacterium]